MTQPPTLRLHVDDRGVSRQLIDLWLPHFDADAVWIVGAELPDDVLERTDIPFVAMSAIEVASVAIELAETAARALVVFASVDALYEAAQLGLPPARVTLQHLEESDETVRLGVSVHLRPAWTTNLSALEALGFSFEIKGMPSVTARPWSVENLAP